MYLANSTYVRRRMKLVVAAADYFRDVGHMSNMSDLSRSVLLPTHNPSDFRSLRQWRSGRRTRLRRQHSSHRRRSRCRRKTVARRAAVAHSQQPHATVRDLTPVGLSSVRSESLRFSSIWREPNVHISSGLAARATIFKCLKIDAPGRIIDRYTLT